MEQFFAIGDFVPVSRNDGPKVATNEFDVDFSSFPKWFFPQTNHSVVFVYCLMGRFFFSNLFMWSSF